MDDAEARFDDFYTARMPALVRTLYLACGDLARAEECAQEAFVRAWLRWSTLDGDNPLGWVRTVAWRLCIDEWRRDRRTARAILKFRNMDSNQMPDTFDVLGLLAGLPINQTHVVVLHYIEDMPVYEVARLLEIPIGTVKSRLSRARESLHQRLEYHLEE